MKKAEPGHMTQHMAKSSKRQVTAEHRSTAPQKGDHFRCVNCGMEIEVTTECKCPEHAVFQCCGQDLQKV